MVQRPRPNVRDDRRPQNDAVCARRVGGALFSIFLSPSRHLHYPMTSFSSRDCSLQHSQIVQDLFPILTFFPYPCSSSTLAYAHIDRRVRP